MKSTYQIRQNCQVNITLRKLTTHNKSLDQQHIMVTINVAEQTYQIAQTRIIKNGIACFYGESFFIPNWQRQIQILVMSQTPNMQRKLAEFVFNTAQLSNKKNTFSLESDCLSLVLEANFTYDHTHFAQTEFDRTFQDFGDIHLKPAAKTPRNQTRKVYSPMAKGQIRGKRMSFRANKEDTVSEYISDSPKKMTLHTNDTLIRIKKSHDSVKEQREEQTADKDSSKVVHPIFRSPKNRQMFKKPIKQPMTPQNSSSNCMFGKKKVEQMVSKVNMRSILYSSMIGLISGATAAKAMHI